MSGSRGACGFVACVVVLLGGACNTARDAPVPASGDLDASFGAGGQVTTAFDVGSPGYTWANAMAIQPDGKIVAAGEAYRRDGPEGAMSYFALARYDASGGLDAGFGTGGRVMTTNGGANAVAIQPGGKIVVAGCGGNAFQTARYDPDGSLDTGFGSNGRATTTFGGSACASAVAIQPDGKIVVAGSAWVTDGWAFALARHLENGDLDASFGTGGIVTTSFDAHAEVNAIAIQADGKVVAVGYSSTSAPTTAFFALARYLEDGSLDAGFGTGGRVTTDVGPGLDDARAIAIQADGRLVAAGYSATNGFLFTSTYALARYGEDGSLDASFGSGGKVTTAVADGYDRASGVAVQADGKIVAAGTSDVEVDGSTWRGFSVARYQGDGTLDTAFGERGTATTRTGASGGANNVECRAVALQADGKIVAAGSSDGVFTVVRYLQ